VRTNPPKSKERVGHETTKTAGKTAPKPKENAATRVVRIQRGPDRGSEFLEAKILASKLMRTAEKIERRYHSNRKDSLLLAELELFSRLKRGSKKANVRRRRKRMAAKLIDEIKLVKETQLAMEAEAGRKVAKVQSDLYGEVEIRNKKMESMRAEYYSDRQIREELAKPKYWPSKQKVVNEFRTANAVRLDLTFDSLNAKKTKDTGASVIPLTAIGPCDVCKRRKMCTNGICQTCKK